MIEEIKVLAKSFYDEIIEYRRHLHRHPELSQQEFGTMEYVADKLRLFGLEPRTGIGKTGVMAMIEGNNPCCYCIALRADYDALPIQECTGLPFSSEVEGVMHACGHDAHAAMLLGAARALSAESSCGEAFFMRFPPRCPSSCVCSGTIVRPVRAVRQRRFASVA